MFRPRKQFLNKIIEEAIIIRKPPCTHVKVAVHSKLRAPEVGRHCVPRASSAPHPGMVEFLRMLGAGRAALEHHAVTEQAAQTELLAPGPGEPRS